MSEQKPSVGRIVHYVSHGSPVRKDGTQAYGSQCRAAIVTEISEYGVSGSATEYSVALCVLNPTGLFFNACGQDEVGKAGGTWHWPERT